MFMALHLLLYSLAFVVVKAIANITHGILVVKGMMMRFLFHK